MATIGFPAVGTLTYNGYTWDGAFNIRVRETPIYDDAQRTVQYTEVMIDVEAYIGDSDPALTLVEMNSIRGFLEEPGKSLRLENFGFGSPLVLVAGSASGVDILFGPHPKVVDWRPTGSNLCVFVKWQVVTYIRKCGALPSSNIVLAFNYDVGVDIDEEGYTTRTITGHALIANNRVGSLLLRSSDQYRNVINAPTLLGFKRRQSYRANAARNRIEFTIVDTQIQSSNPYPFVATSIDGEHRTQWARGQEKTAHILHSLRVTMKPRADLSAAQTYIVAVGLVKKRIAAQKLAMSSGGSLIIQSIEVNETLFGRVSNVSISWLQVSENQNILKTYIQATGQFLPLTTAWEDWDTGMILPRNPRGYSKWGHTPNDDRIVDPCYSDLPTINNSVTVEPYTNIPLPLPDSLQNDTPQVTASILQFSEAVFGQFSRPTSVQAVLQSTDNQQGDQNQEASNGMNFGAQSGFIKHILQQSGAARYDVGLFGHGLRAGYPFPKRKRLTFGSESESVEVGGTMVQWVDDNWLGIPIYKAYWTQLYSLNESPGTLAVAGNPLVDFDEGTQTIVG